MTWKEYNGILKASHATGGGDNTVDPNPQKDPNFFLAPMAGGSQAMHIACLIIAYLVIVYLVILITGKIAYKAPSL